MIFGIVLLLLELVFFIVAEIYLIKRDLPFAFYFFGLYLYSTPALIGYYFLPDLSQKLSAYFGKEYWYEFYLFIILSLISFFVFSTHYIKKLNDKRFKHIRRLRYTGHESFWSMVIILISDLIQVLNLIINSDNIGYTISTNANILTKIAGLLFQFDVGIILIYFYFVRIKKGNKFVYIYNISILTINLIIFLLYGIRSGNRHVLLRIVLGILYIEIKLKYLNRKTIIRYGLTLFFLLIAFEFLRSSRSNGIYKISFSFANLLSNDYYPPAHMLFTAMRYKCIDPLLVLKSNIANSLFGLGVDYLQKGLMEKIISFTVTRNASYAFYVFTEGYMFMGFFGFLYNGCIISTLIYLWRYITITNDQDYTTTVTAIMCGYSIDFVRGQTSYFIKTLWLFLIPCILFYCAFIPQENNNE